MSDQTSDTVIEQAAWWQAQLADDELPESERAAFAAWIDASPEHRLTFERMSALADRIEGQSDIHRQAVRSLAKSHRPRLVGGILTVALLMGAGALTLRQAPIRIWMADYRTATGEQRSVKLADGSQLQLDTNSAANVHIAGTPRNVELLQGAVFVEVAHVPGRPFEVRTRDGSARARGTAYSVRKEQDGTVVAVEQSQVEACTPEMRRCLILRPGQQARLSPTGIDRLDPIDPESLRARAEGLLTVDDAPLAEVLGELNRYRRTPIRFAPETIADLRITGVFPLRDSDEALDTIAGSMPVLIDRADPEHPVVRRAR